MCWLLYTILKNTIQKCNLKKEKNKAMAKRDFNSKISSVGEDPLYCDAYPNISFVNTKYSFGH